MIIIIISLHEYTFTIIVHYILQPNQQRIALLILNHTILLGIVLLLTTALTYPQLRTAIAIFNGRILDTTTTALETVQGLITLEITAGRARTLETVTTKESFITKVRRTSNIYVRDLTMRGL